MWLTNFSLVLTDEIIPEGALRIEDGHIAEIRAGAAPEGAIDGGGRLLAPGFIDMHGDMIEVELEPRPRVDFPMEVALGHLDARLAASGVTTAYAAVSFSRGVRDGARRSFEHTSAVIRALDEARGAMRVDHKIHARFDITFDNAVGVLADLVREARVDLVSLMDHTPGQGQYRDLERFIQSFATNNSISLTEARQRITTRIAERTRPQDVLLGNLRQVSEICRSAGVPMASHDDDSADKANLMADLGAAISEFPVTMEAAEAAARRGMMCAMGAPNALRGRSYSGNLSARDAHGRGLLQILAADYHPAAILPALRALAETDPGGLSGAFRLATSHPARALGLDDRGSLTEGKRADLIAIDGARVTASWREGRIIYADQPWAMKGR